MQFEDLNYRMQWLDGTLFAASQEDPVATLTYETMTLQEFIKKMEDPTICSNFLDRKNMEPSPPPWAIFFFNSAIAWNHTMHLQISQEAKKRNKEQPVVFDKG